MRMSSLAPYCTRSQWIWVNMNIRPHRSSLAHLPKGQGADVVKLITRLEVAYTMYELERDLVREVAASTTGPLPPLGDHNTSSGSTWKDRRGRAPPAGKRTKVPDQEARPVKSPSVREQRSREARIPRGGRSSSGTFPCALVLIISK